MKSSIVFLFVCVSTFTGYSQSKFSLGIQGGRSSLMPQTVGVPDQLADFNARGAGGVNMFVYGRYFFQPDWSVRLGGGIIGYRAAHSHTYGLTPTAFRGVQPQVVTSLDYHLLLGESNLGIILSAGLNANRAHLYDNHAISSDEGVPLTGVRGLNGNGEVVNLGVLGHEVEYTYSRQKTLFHFRPELTLFKQLGKHKVLASFVYGYALKEPILTADYKVISYQEEFHSARHQFDGSFTALQLGYEFRF